VEWSSGGGGWSVGWGNVDKSSRFAVPLQNRLVLHSFYFFFFR